MLKPTKSLDFVLRFVRSVDSGLRSVLLGFICRATAHTVSAVFGNDVCDYPKTPIRKHASDCPLLAVAHIVLRQRRTDRNRSTTSRMTFRSIFVACVTSLLANIEDYRRRSRKNGGQTDNRNIPLENNRPISTRIAVDRGVIYELQGFEFAFVFCDFYVVSIDPFNATLFFLSIF